MDIFSIIYLLFGFSLSINQGKTVVLGKLTTGADLGADVIMLSDIFVYLLLIFQRNRSRHSRYYKTVLIAKIFAIIFLLLTFTGIRNADEPVRVKFMIVHLARAVLIFYCLASRLHDIRHVRPFVIGLLLGLGFQGFVGFYQWQIGHISIPFLKTEYGLGRVTGTMGVPNAFGVYLVSLLPLAIRTVIYTDLKPKILWITISIWAMGSLIATYTRGAWLAFLVSMGIFFTKDFFETKVKPLKKLVIVFLIIFSATGIYFKYGKYIAKRMTGATESLAGEKKQSRYNLALDALRIIGENKLTGVGLEQYRFYADPTIPGLRIVHNAYLLIGAEQGIPSLLLFLIIQGIAFFTGLKLLKSRDVFLYNVGVATLTSFIAVAIYHMIAPDYRMVGILLQHWRISGMLLGLVVCQDLMERHKSRSPLKKNEPRAQRFSPYTDHRIHQAKP
jgi:hypothetical protein